MSTSASEPKWITVAKAEIGEVEFAGNEDNPRVLEYLNSTKINENMVHDSTPWCSAFVTWCLEQSEIKSTDSAWAKSYLNWGIKLEKPIFGCIVVLERGEGFGHVGFYVQGGLTSIKILGGNQGDQVSEKWYLKRRILGYRWPKFI